jgi:hypothetical protein
MSKSIFLKGQFLSRGDLSLLLRNESCLPTNAFSVTWTVFSMAGQQVSGLNLSAINPQVGEYYAPWCANVPDGDYKIIWNHQKRSIDPVLSETMKFCVLDPVLYQCTSVFPAHTGCFYVGTQLGPDDLVISIRDRNGFLVDPSSITWTVYNSKDCLISTLNNQAIRISVGKFYANWSINAVFTGTYKIVWEFQESSNFPKQSKAMLFGVINPNNFFMTA